MDLSDYRKEYTKGGLRRSDLVSNPIDLFQTWFLQATKAGIPEPNAMTLGTVSEESFPFQRTVLLKKFDETGFTFFTNYSSRKAEQIAHNPKVSLLFPWVSLERQILVLGEAEKISRKESLEYFHSRPRESQIGAWVSDQSSIIESREVLEKRLDAFSEKFEGREIPLPDCWGGYRVKPSSMEFWQGGNSRIHDRFFYKLEESGEWKISRLAP